LEGTSAFQADAVQLVARKVAAVSGDARRALDICRRAALISETKFRQNQEETSVVVKVEDVHDALKEIFSSTKFMAVRESALQHRVFLQAIAHEFKISGLSEAIFSNVLRHHEDICKVERFPIPSTSQLMEIALSLYERRIILLETTPVFLKTKILLNVSMDDIDFALKSNNE
jgi:origin recognition complex subunit 1